jgi:hypothetical protein
METSMLATMRKIRKMDFAFILTADGIIDRLTTKRCWTVQEEIQIGIEVNDGGMIPLNSSKIQ